MKTGDRRAGVGTIALPFCVGNRQTPERLKGRRKFEDGRRETGGRKLAPLLAGSKPGVGTAALEIVLAAVSRRNQSGEFVLSCLRGN
ncbi:hypothetical protein [uncultured Imperialibacter sp.]|uniref:hypothetical protein n=1 Tax=uncultured Imperialibacter sp. TaxID=1672639 RepID=UPI0030DCB8DB